MRFRHVIMSVLLGASVLSACGSPQAAASVTTTVTKTAVSVSTAPATTITATKTNLSTVTDTVAPTATATASADGEAAYCVVFLGVIDHLTKVGANAVATNDMAFWAREASDADSYMTNLGNKYLDISGGSGKTRPALMSFQLAVAAIKLAAGGGTSTAAADAATQYDRAANQVKTVCS